MFGFPLRALGNEVDHAAGRHAAIEHRSRPLEHLQLLYGHRIYLGLQVPLVVLQQEAVIEVLVVVKAADVEQIQPVDRPAAQLGIDPGHVAQRLAHRADATLFQGLAVHYRDGLGRLYGVEPGLGRGVAIGLTQHRQGLVGQRRVLAGGRGGQHRACQQGGDGRGDHGQWGVNKLHLILDCLLHVNGNKYHLHFIVLICPGINNLGHVGGSVTKKGGEKGAI